MKSTEFHPVHYDAHGRLRLPLLFWLVLLLQARTWVLFVIAGASREQGTALLNLFYPDHDNFWLGLIPGIPAVLAFLLSGRRATFPRTWRVLYFLLLLAQVVLLCWQPWLWLNGESVSGIGLALVVADIVALIWLLDDTRVEWNKYEKTISNIVKKFIEKLNGKYHPQTWLFYGASKSNPSDGFLAWEERIPQGVKEAQRCRENAANPFELSPLRTHQLISSASPGDGTVPTTSVRTSSSRIQGVLATDVDHEGAYAVDPVDLSRSVYSDLSDALVFTVRSVVKIVQQVPAP